MPYLLSGEQDREGGRLESRLQWSGLIQVEKSTTKDLSISTRIRKEGDRERKGTPFGQASSVRAGKKGLKD